MQGQTTAESGKRKIAAEESPKLVLSQRDYQPSPYQDSAWEVVGERLTDLEFMPLELPIIRKQAAAADPMFEEFGSMFPKDAIALLHNEGAEVAKTASGEVHHKREPELDPEMIERIRADAFEQGRQQGFKEGEEAAKGSIAERYEELSSRVEAISSSLQEEKDRFTGETQQRALQFALAVAKKIVVTTAEIRPQYIFDVIRQGLQTIGVGTPMRIRVSPDDYEFLMVIGLPPELSTQETGIQYLADEAIKSGCVIETNFGEIDMQLERMWEQIRDNLFEVAK